VQIDRSDRLRHLFSAFASIEIGSHGQDNESGRGNTHPASPLMAEDAPIPMPGHGEVLIKVVANGTCRTDLHSAPGWNRYRDGRFITGRYQAAGHSLRRRGTETHEEAA